jgi:hypothetical protein
MLNVDKEVERVRLSVQKAAPSAGPAFSMQVKLLADVSGSFRDEYQSGLVDPFFQASLCIAAAIDPDKVVQVIAFGDSAADTGDYGIDNPDGIVQEFLGRVPRSVLWSGTDYHAGLQILSESEPEQPAGFWGSLFGGKKAPTQSGARADGKPWLVALLSDGEDYGNRDAFMKELRKLTTSGVFVVLFGANSDKSVTFKRLVDAADAIEGVTFHRVSDLSGISTQALYDKVFDDEFTRWYNAYSGQNTTKAV